MVLFVKIQCLLFVNFGPKWHFLRHDKELNEYKEVPKEFLQQVADEGHAFIIRYDAPLIFTSVHKFMKVLMQSVKRWDQLTLSKRYHDSNGQNTLIIDCSGFPYVDYLGLCTLKKVYKEFSDQSVTVKFAAPKAHLMRMFRETDFYEVVPKQNVFQTVKQAVNSCHPKENQKSRFMDFLDSDEEHGEPSFY